MTTTEIGTSTTLDFPNVVARRLAEIAIDRERERQQRLHKLEDKALGSFERLGHVIDLGDGSYVIEVTSKGSQRDETLWAAVPDMNTRADFQRFYTRDEALLRLVELRNGGGLNDKGHIYAARMLGAGAKPTEEEAAR